MNLFTKLPFVLSLVVASGLLMSSCGDSGTDPEVEASNEKFIGTYIGEITCDRLLATVVNEPTLEFTITNTSPASDDMVSVNLPIPEFPLELTGTVTGNSVNMEETKVENVMVATFTLDVLANGTGTLAGNALSATINLTGFQAGTSSELGQSTCTINANKQ